MKTLFVTGGNAGGTGKTTALTLVADWLKTRNRKRAYIDADPGNRGTAKSFRYWLDGQPVRELNIQDPEHLNAIFTLSEGAPEDVDILCDLPANAGGNMASWWRDIATAETWAEIGVRLVTVIPITPLPGGCESALKWLEVVGPQGLYLIALNRTLWELAPKPVEEAFPEWFSVDTTGYDLKTVEIGHLYKDAIQALAAAKTLPSQFKGHILVQKRIRSWVEKVHTQLDALDLLKT